MIAMLWKRKSGSSWPAPIRAEQTASIGIYTHVRDRWGASYAQPILLNERQAGAPIEGVIREELPTPSATHVRCCPSTPAKKGG